jgi:hypothetical protein
MKMEKIGDFHGIFGDFRVIYAISMLRNRKKKKLPVGNGLHNALLAISGLFLNLTHHQYFSMFTTDLFIDENSELLHRSISYRDSLVFIPLFPIMSYYI